MRAETPGATNASSSSTSSSRQLHLLQRRRRRRESVAAPAASLSSLLPIESVSQCRIIDISTSRLKLAPGNGRRRRTLPSISSPPSILPFVAFASAASSSSSSPAPSGLYSSFNPAATRVPRISRIDVPFAVICLADELYARMAESDVASAEGAAECAKALAQVLPPPPPPPPPSGGRSSGGTAESSSYSSSSALNRDVPFLSEREIVAVLRRLGRLGGPGTALAMRDFLEQTNRGYTTNTRVVGAVLLHVAALNASPQAADDVRARMERDGVPLDAECWNRLVYAKAKARDARAAMRATDEAFAAGVVVDVVTYAALMACLERDAGVLNSATSVASFEGGGGGGGADAASVLSPSAPLEERLRATAQPCLDLWRRMQAAGQRGNEFVHRALIGALCRARDTQRALEVVCELYPACAAPPSSTSSSSTSLPPPDHSSSASSSSPYYPAPFPPAWVSGQLMAGAFRAGDAAVARAGAAMAVDPRAAPDAAAAGRPIELVVRTAAGGPSLAGGPRAARRKRRGETKSRFRGNNSTFSASTFSSTDSDDGDSDELGVEDGIDNEAERVTGFSNPRAIEPSLEDMRLALELYETLRGRYAAEWRGGGGVGESSGASSSSASSSSSNSSASSSSFQNQAPSRGLNTNNSGGGGNSGNNSNNSSSNGGLAVPVVSFGRLMSLAQRLEDADVAAKVIAWAEEDASAVALSSSSGAAAAAALPGAAVPPVLLGLRIAARAALVFMGASRWAEAAEVLAGDSAARGGGGAGRSVFGKQCAVLEKAAAAKKTPLPASLQGELEAVRSALLACLTPSSEGSASLASVLAPFSGGAGSGGRERGGGAAAAAGAGAGARTMSSGGGGYNYAEGAQRSRTRYSYAASPSSSASSSPSGSLPPAATTGRSQRLAAAVGGIGGGGFSLSGNGGGAGRGPQRKPGPGLGVAPYSSPTPPNPPAEQQEEEKLLAQKIPGKRGAGRVAATALLTAAEREDARVSAAAGANEAAAAEATASSAADLSAAASFPSRLPGRARPKPRPSPALSAAGVGAAAARLAATFKAGGISPLEGLTELALIRAAAERLPAGDGEDGGAGKEAAALAVEAAEAVLRVKKEK